MKRGRKMKDYKITAKNIIDKVGGKDNIVDLTHCATRLRFLLKDKTMVDQEGLKSVDGVVGVVEQGQRLQAVIGNEVGNVYNAIIDLGINDEQSLDEVIDHGKTEKSTISNIIDTITECMTPMIPALTAAGIIKLILSLLTTFTNIDPTMPTYRILDIIGDSAFYFMPFLLAVNAAKRFKVETSLALIVVGVFLHPNFTAWVASGDVISFLSVPVKAVSYGASVIPALLMVWLMSYIQKGVDKVTPKALKLILNPSLILLISAPIALVAIGPLGSFAGDLLSGVIDLLSNKLGFALVGILAAAWPFIVMTGMHHALTPIFLATFASTGQESLILIAQVCANIAQAGASWAVALRSKRKQTKELATAAGLSAIMGITEPAIYGVTLKLKKPMIAASIGAGIAGLFGGLMHVTLYVLQNSIMAVLAFSGDKGTSNIIYGIIMIAVSLVVAFVLSYIFGFKEED